MSRNEEIMAAIANGDTMSLTPHSRAEAILLAHLNGESVDFEPHSRMEALLKRVCETAGSGGGTTIVGGDRTNLGYFYQYLNADGSWDGYTDEDGMFHYPDDSRSSWLTDIPLPSGYKNVRSFANLFKFFRYDPEAFSYVNAPIPVLSFTGTLDMSAADSVVGLFDCFRGLNLDAFVLPDCSKFSDFSNMFRSCSLLTSIPSIDTSSAIDMSGMFRACVNLTSNPNLNTSKCESMKQMFSSCSKITEITGLDTGANKDASGMFEVCISLTSISALNTVNAMTTRDMFRACRSLFGDLTFDLRSCTDMGCMFYSCMKITSVLFSNTSGVRIMDNLFRDCSALKSVMGLDMNSVTEKSYVPSFYGCKSLTTLELKNIKVNLTIGSGTSYGHQLEKDSLIGIIKELKDTGSTKTLTMGSANIAKLADVYVRVIDGVVEVCESTDDGACTTQAYLASINWALK